MVNPPEELRTQAHSLETAGSDPHGCTGELNIKSTAHTQENWICLLNQKPKCTFENLGNDSCPELCYSHPLPFSEPRLQPFGNPNWRGKETHLRVCSAQSRDPGEPALLLPALRNTERTPRFGRTQRSRFEFQYRYDLSKFHFSRGLPLLEENDTQTTTLKPQETTWFT